MFAQRSDLYRTRSRVCPFREELIAAALPPRQSFFLPVNYILTAFRSLVILLL